LSERAYKQYREKWKVLGVDGRLSLTRLWEDPYLQLRMNATLSESTQVSLDSHFPIFLAEDSH
jgi:hypothetical protein